MSYLPFWVYFSENFFVVDFWGQGFSGCFCGFLCGVLCLLVSLLGFWFIHIRPPSRWRTGYGGVFLRGVPCFFCGILGCFLTWERVLGVYAGFG